MNAIGGNAREQLKAIIERVENVDAEIDGKKEDIKQIYAEAEGNGLDKAAIKAIVARRKKQRKNKDKLAEREAIIDNYMVALGEFANSPLGQAAISRVSA